MEAKLTAKHMGIDLMSDRLTDGDCLMWFKVTVKYMGIDLISC